MGSTKRASTRNEVATSSCRYMRILRRTVLSGKVLECGGRSPRALRTKCAQRQRCDPVHLPSLRSLSRTAEHHSDIHNGRLSYSDHRHVVCRHDLCPFRSQQRVHRIRSPFFAGFHPGVNGICIATGQLVVAPRTCDTVAMGLNGKPVHDYARVAPIFLTSAFILPM